jgi:hypothetical protein
VIVIAIECICDCSCCCDSCLGAAAKQKREGDEVRAIIMISISRITFADRAACLVNYRGAVVSWTVSIRHKIFKMQQIEAHNNEGICENMTSRVCL